MVKLICIKCGIVRGSDPNGSIAISHSDDGINSSLEGETDIPPTALHAFVIYDENGFVNPDNGYLYPYRMWYWNNDLYDPSAILYSYSKNGINWYSPKPCLFRIRVPQLFLVHHLDDIFIHYMVQGLSFIIHLQYQCLGNHIPILM